MSSSWIASQLLRMADGRSAMKLEQPRYNPRPPGVIREGSATDAVLAFLQAHPMRFFTNGQIIQATGKTDKAVSWALLYLRSQGHIECTPDAGRNERYLRYRTVKE